jgi:hypothetical protein
MALNTSKLNSFLFLKLPSAFLCGVRVKEINNSECQATVTHRWINQNPFNSMYFAVQAMAAELTTGALVMNEIQKSGHKISMLVANNKSSFSKKATGKITFICTDGILVKEIVRKAIDTGEGQTVWLKSIGYNQEQIQVSEMHFEWTLKIKSKYPRPLNIA